MSKDTPPAGWNRCPGCGQSTSSSARYCPACGEPLVVRCPQCGESWRFWNARRFCPRCGVLAVRQ